MAHAIVSEQTPLLRAHLPYNQIAPPYEFPSQSVLTAPATQVPTEEFLEKRTETADATVASSTIFGTSKKTGAHIRHLLILMYQKQMDANELLIQLRVLFSFQKERSQAGWEKLEVLLI